MGTILAFAGSNSSTSVNYKLVKYTASLIEEHKVSLMNMANYPFPMYSEDHEKENGFSNSLVEVMNDIKSSDGIIISVNEHNGNVSAYFKNFLDWLSRLDKRFLEGKKVLLMSTSPGKRGGIGAFEIANNILPRFGAAVVIGFSLPSFYDNFEDGKGIIDTELSKVHEQAIADFLAEI
ncbi:NAD(P)H-dependent oxidoreductase [Maribacter algarum]|uniref:NAD(P)H-dependent oxidoreductase n=1 Tax=Maribacter algarum (ex Zhang et al. 2020) TaxID=2578118 RepID=A0A5S3PQX2_9FLAO|nr:NAD(P)H-dependent oxidoreductase [Maribacter algarum]TMM57094.1 NAD(P)H-dependent oxidoreductase [Maribacter algarum]